MLTFYDQLSTKIPYNLHSHTQFCDGRNSMEEFAAEAARLGFSHYGFSPHSPVPLESPCNMPKEKMEEYFTEAKRLKDRYSDSLKLYASMEIDYLGDFWGPSNEYFDKLPLDYRIGSVHFVPTQEGIPVDVDGSPERFAARLKECFHSDLRYVVEKFYTQSIEMVEKGGFDIIGHFDKIALNASFVDSEVTHQDWYRALVQELINKIADNNITVEINTKHFGKYKRFFPDTCYWKELTDKDIQIVVNSDAHFTDLINASREEAITLLDTYTKSGSAAKPGC